MVAAVLSRDKGETEKISLIRQLFRTNDLYKSSFILVEFEIFCESDEVFRELDVAIQARANLFGNFG